MDDKIKKLCISMIKQVAIESNYVVGDEELHFEITKDNWHSVAYMINTHQYIQVRQWEATDDEGNGEYGRSVYSIRSIPDAVLFCQILVASEAIRARR